MRGVAGDVQAGGVPCLTGVAGSEVCMRHKSAMFAECVVRYCTVLKGALRDAAEWLKSHGPANGDDDVEEDDEADVVDESDEGGNRVNDRPHDGSSYDAPTRAAREDAQGSGAGGAPPRLAADEDALVEDLWLGEGAQGDGWQHGQDAGGEDEARGDLWLGEGGDGGSREDPHWLPKDPPSGSDPPTDGVYVGTPSAVIVAGVACR